MADCSAYGSWMMMTMIGTNVDGRNWLIYKVNIIDKENEQKQIFDMSCRGRKTSEILLWFQFTTQCLFAYLYWSMQSSRRTSVFRFLLIFHSDLSMKCRAQSVSTHLKKIIYIRKTSINIWSISALRWQGGEQKKPIGITSRWYWPCILSKIS